MQMSRVRAFVFVEGKSNDSYFYGKICETVFPPANVTYEIVKAQELPGNTGGKQTLIEFFLYLRQKKCLIDSFKGKLTGSIFFLDKDVDDFLRKRRRSAHVVYTRFYDIEGHIFSEGDLGEATAAAASLDGQVARTMIGDYGVWRHQAASKWKEWVKLCLFARKHSINSESSYSRVSQVNTPLHGPLNTISYAQYLALLETRSGLSTAEFSRAYATLSSGVDKRYLSRTFDLVFKGKWYAAFLEAHIRSAAGVRPINSNGLASRLDSAVALTLDFGGHWAEHFKAPLRALIAHL